MKKFKTTLPQNGWKGLHTKNVARSINVDDDEMTAGSQNVDTSKNGVLTKRLDVETYGAVSSSVKDMYEAVFASGERHLLTVQGGVLRYSTGDGVFNSVVNGSSYAPLANFEFATYRDRVYFCNGVDQPQVYDKIASYGGVGYTAPRTKEMGAQPPTTAPSGVQGGAGNVANDTYNYAVTFLYYDYEESNGGPESSAITVAGGPAVVNLTAIPVGGYGVTARKVYRKGLLDPVFRLVGTITNNTSTVFTDNTSLGSSLIPTDNNQPPLFKYIVQHKDVNFIAGIPGEPYNVRSSNEQFPDIFSDFRFVPCNQRDPITGLAVYQDRVMVMNRRSFGYISGTTAETRRYVEIPGSVGCVDNRTIQVRTLRGVPTLIWLAEDGFYMFNGSVVEHASEKIEDLLDVNVRQSNYTQSSHTDTADSDFTPPPAGSSLVVAGGQITTQNPKHIDETQADWESTSQPPSAGNSTPATRLPALVNKLAVTPPIPRVSGDFSLTTAIYNAGFKLPQTAAFYGETKAQTSAFPLNRAVNTSADASAQQNEIAVKIVAPRAGTITSVKFDVTYDFLHASASPITRNFYVRLYSDAGNQPGGVLAQSGPFPYAFPAYPASQKYSPPALSVTLPVQAGVTYWLALFGSSTDISNDCLLRLRDPIGLCSTGASWTGNARTKSRRVKGGSCGGLSGTGPWGDIEASGLSGTVGSISGFYNMVYTPVASSGQAQSPIYDAGMAPAAVSGGLQAVLSSFAASYPAGTSATVRIEQSDADGILFTSGGANYTFQNFVNPASVSANFVLSRRYWRITLLLSTTDNVYTPSVDFSALEFPSTADFTSATIDKTIDVQSVDEIRVDCTIPAGCSIAAYVLENAVDASWNAATVNGPYNMVNGVNTFSPGPALLRFSQLRFVLTRSGASIPYVSSVSMKWHTEATLVSQEINIGYTPSGWGLVQSDQDVPATSSLVLDARSSATTPVLSAWSPISVGSTPDQSLIPPQQYFQWRAKFTAYPDALPILRDFTINFLRGDAPSVRAASIFHKRTYFASLAEKGQDQNSIVVAFDENGNWSLYRGLNVGTFALFLNVPRAGDSVSGDVLNWMIPHNVNGNSILMRVRTKAFDFGDASKRKSLLKLYLVGKSQGQSITVRYSVDDGQTWYDMIDYDGMTTFTLPNSGKIFTKRLSVQSGQILTGTTIMLEIECDGPEACEIHEVTMHGVTREEEVNSEND